MNRYFVAMLCAGLAVCSVARGMKDQQEIKKISRYIERQLEKQKKVEKIVDIEKKFGKTIIGKITEKVFNTWGKEYMQILWSPCKISSQLIEIDKPEGWTEQVWIRELKGNEIPGHNTTIWQNIKPGDDRYLKELDNQTATKLVEEDTQGRIKNYARAQFWAASKNLIENNQEPTETELVQETVKLFNNPGTFCRFEWNLIQQAKRMSSFKKNVLPEFEKDRTAREEKKRSGNNLHNKVNDPNGYCDLIMKVH